MKLTYFIGLLVTILMYVVFVLVYKPLVTSICLENGCHLIGNDSDLFNAETFLFCLYILFLFILIAKTKNSLGIYFQTTGLTVTLVCASLLVNIAFIDYSTKISLDALIINQVSVDYRLLYLLATIALFPVCFKQLIMLIHGKNILFQYSFLSDLDLDFRIVRFMAKLIDIGIVILFAFIFSKVVVLYPDLPLMVLIGMYFYLFTIEYSIGTSIGKLIVGLKVVGIKNDDLSGFRIFLRTIIRLVPFYSLGILFNKKGLHDYISNAKVVKVNRQERVNNGYDPDVNNLKLKLKDSDK